MNDSGRLELNLLQTRMIKRNSLTAEWEQKEEKLLTDIIV